MKSASEKKLIKKNMKMFDFGCTNLKMYEGHSEEQILLISAKILTMVLLQIKQKLGYHS